MSDIYNFIKKHQGNPTLLKHEQIIQGIIDAIDTGSLKRDSLLPSVNNAVHDMGVARKTVVKAYNGLKERGIIESKNRLGYYVINEKVQQNMRVFLLLNAFNMYQEVLYNSIIDRVEGHNISIDVFFHHCNPSIFQYLLSNSKGKYSKYIVSPFKNEAVRESLQLIEKDKILLLARDAYTDIADSHCVQNFSGKLFTALESAIDDIKRYKRFILIFNAGNNHPEEIPRIFKKFCEQNSLSYNILKIIQKKSIRQDDSYFVIEDSQMLKIIEFAEEYNKAPGKDIGLLSYNDTPMKKFIKNGISCISTDFAKMGQLAGEWLLNNQKIQVTIPTKYIKRNSL